MYSEDLYFEEPEEPSGIGLSLVLMIALVLLLVAFVWFVLRLDPWTNDFIEGDDPVVTVTESTSGI